MRGKLPSLSRTLANPGRRKEVIVTDEMKGHGTATGDRRASPTSETEELRARIEQLEAAKREAEQPRRVVQRMVPMGAGFLDQNGKPIMVPYSGPELGEQLTRQQFTGEVRNEMARAEAIRTEQAEDARAIKAADATPPRPSGPWSYLDRLRAAPGSMIDTRSGTDTPGPSRVDTSTIKLKDKAAG
jgi:hypothetical protein